MTDYEIGFQDGERTAWEQRHELLPMRPSVLRSERERGYWDGRLPHSRAWEDGRRISQAWWCERTGRYTEAA